MEKWISARGEKEECGPGERLEEPRGRRQGTLRLQTLGGAVAQFGRLRLERGLSFMQSVLGSLKEF